MDYKYDISIIVPLFNEKESLPELVAWIKEVLQREGRSYEIIMVDDGSTDGSWEKIRELAASDTTIRGISFRRNYGKSAALYEGFAAAEGRVVVTMDADLQDSPEEVPELYRMVVEDGWDVVSGWKQHRQDNKLTKNLPSKLYNWTARKVTGIKLHDMNCGLKAYKSEVVKNIEVYGEMHRYIPYLAKNAGFGKITEKPVHHQKRKYGVSKFGIERFVNGDRLDHSSQTGPSVPRRPLPRSNRSAAFLPRTSDNYSRSSLFPCRIHWRDDFEKFLCPKRIQHQRNYLTT